jgi:hypothetical protein
MESGVGRVLGEDERGEERGSGGHEEGMGRVERTNGDGPAWRKEGEGVQSKNQGSMLLSIGLMWATDLKTGLKRQDLRAMDAYAMACCLHTQR